LHISGNNSQSGNKLVFGNHTNKTSITSDFIVKSNIMKNILKTARRVAPHSTTVLITGETGVGKEELASYIQQNSSRSTQPFVKVNCGAIPESLMESELFGYEQGAFTGARKEGSVGLFEAANHGTILLDEISELPLKAQSKLLRTLQECEVRRVGGTWSKIIDVRIIAITNQNLQRLTETKKFRKDLFYRLSVVTINVPPLRERREEINPLIDHFLNLFWQKYGIKKSFSVEAIKKLKIYNWPGNIRELKNIVEQLVVTLDEQVIKPEHLPSYIKQNKVPKGIEFLPLKKVVEDAERRAIKVALSQCGSSREAAVLLDINYATLMRKIKRLNITYSKGPK